MVQGGQRIKPYQAAIPGLILLTANIKIEAVSKVDSLIESNRSIAMA
jgi:hypothetical protein